MLSTLIESINLPYSLLHVWKGERVTVAVDHGSSILETRKSTNSFFKYNIVFTSAI